MNKNSESSSRPSDTSTLNFTGKNINTRKHGKGSPSRKDKRQKSSSSPHLSSDSESGDIIWAVEHLIDVIDNIEVKFGNANYSKGLARVSTNNKDAPSRLVPIYHAGTSKEEDPAVAKAIIPSVDSFPRTTTERQSRVEVFNTSGELDLDALETWASTTDIEIDWPSIDNICTTSSVPYTDTKAVKDKLRKSDIAVEEIDAIIGTIPDEKNAPRNRGRYHPEYDKVRDTTNDVTSERNVITPSSPSFAVGPTIPSITCSNDFASVRLPPLKGSILNEDIFHRKLTDMSALHIPRFLPKLKQPTDKPLGNIQQSKEEICATISQQEPSISSPNRAVKYVQEYLLPGQVSETNYDRKSTEAVSVRTIVLDYGSDKKKRGTKGRARKFCRWLNCCCVQTDDVSAYVDGTEESPKDSFEEMRFKIEGETQHSLPRRIWGRLRRCFGF